MLSEWLCKLLEENNILLKVNFLTFFKTIFNLSCSFINENQIISISQKSDLCPYRKQRQTWSLAVAVKATILATKLIITDFFDLVDGRIQNYVFSRLSESALLCSNNIFN